MKTPKLIAAAVIRLSLVAGAAWAGQDGGANSPRLAADAHGVVVQNLQR